MSRDLVLWPRGSTRSSAMYDLCTPRTTISRRTFLPTSMNGENGDANGSSVLFDHEDIEGVGEFSRNTPYRRVASILDRARLILARFGRLSGMRLPGITYSSMQSETASSRHTTHTMGGGMSQDGVFSNLNAKPETRRSAVDPHDRGDDDDLADDTPPPTYEVAAADAAPTYWESNVFGGSSLADSEGVWSENSAYVGEVSDMLQDGMMVGTIFAFLWNLFVSTSFQFIGFVLTFLLHSTHAAKFGSRAGLGISLLQYGYDLRLTVQSSLESVSSQENGNNDNNEDNMPSSEAIQRSNIGCDLVMALGIFLFLDAVIKFYLLYRKSSKIVAESHRQERETVTLTNDNNSPASEEPVPFVTRFANWIRSGPIALITETVGNIQRSVSHDISVFMGDHGAHSAEDYVIRPGYGFDNYPIIFSLRDSALHANMNEEEFAHHLGLTDPFTGRVQSFAGNEPAHELRSVRFM